MLLGFSWVPELPPLYPPAFNILPLQHRTPWRRPKPPETRITALASYTEEAFFLFSHSTHQKSVQKGEEKKRRGNAASHHQIFSVLNLHTRSILLCLLFVTVGKCGFAFVLHWPIDNRTYEMWDFSFTQQVSRLFHRTWHRAVWYKRTSFRGIQSWRRADVSRHHEGSKFLTPKDRSSRFIQNISSHVPNYTSHFRTPHS